MDSVKGAMLEVEFEGSDFHSPIPYTMMYVQWEANKVKQRNFISFICKVTVNLTRSYLPNS